MDIWETSDGYTGEHVPGPDCPCGPRIFVRHDAKGLRVIRQHHSFQPVELLPDEDAEEYLRRFAAAAGEAAGERRDTVADSPLPARRQTGNGLPGDRTMTTRELLLDPDAVAAPSPAERARQQVARVRAIADRLMQDIGQSGVRGPASEDPPPAAPDRPPTDSGQAGTG